MTRSTIANRSKVAFDADLELYDYDTAAISATTNGTAKALNADKFQAYKAVVDVAAHSGYSAGSAFWTISIQVATTSGGTYTTVGSVVPDGTARQLEIPLSGAAAAYANSDPNFIRVTATKTSTAGNLTFGCFLAPAHG